MNNRKIEFLVGCFVLVGIIAVLYLAIKVGGGRLTGGGYYELQARFSSVSGVNAGSRVEIAGVKVGTVTRIELNEHFFAIVTFELPDTLRLGDDTLLSVKTSGLIGDRFLDLSPGIEEPFLKAGDMIVDTVSALDIESLISRFALGGIDDRDN